MSAASKTIMAYGVYALGAGAEFLFIPHLILSTFGFETTTEHWVRIVAILTLGLGFYYIASARAEAEHFFKISAIGRTWFFAASTALCLIGVAPMKFILFGSVDLVSAAWTWWALRRDREGHH